MTTFFRIPVLAALLAGAPLPAADWPRWRGPDGNGVSTESPLPLTWSVTDNVRWKVPLPGEGMSSPIVVGDRVFVTAAEKEGTRRLLIALDRATGRTLWTHSLTHDDPERANFNTGHAAPTPACDGRRVVAAFGNAGVVCCDLDGHQLWHHKFEPFDTELGLASSPVIDDGRVYLVCDHDGDRFRTFDSFLLALDLGTGRVAWKAERRDLGRSWSTPILVPASGSRLLIVAGQDRLRAYDPDTGAERWSVEGLTGWVAPSPVFAHGLILATSGKNGPVLAVRPGEKPAVVWKHDTGGPYVCSPVCYGDYLYVVTEAGILTCYEAATGNVTYRERLTGKFTASPVAGDGKVYLMNEAGTTFVVEAGPKFRVLATNALGEPVWASPAIANGDVFLRTEKHLFRIGPMR